MQLQDIALGRCENCGEQPVAIIENDMCGPCAEAEDRFCEGQRHVAGEWFDAAVQKALETLTPMELHSRIDTLSA